MDMAVDVKKRIIKNIVWKEMEKILKGQHIDFVWGKKKFRIRRIK